MSLGHSDYMKYKTKAVEIYNILNENTSKNTEAVDNIV